MFELEAMLQPLIDLENYTQEECAEQMCVSRTTVQGVYDAARKKIADALVNGKCLQIGGGDYVICEYYRSECGRGCRGFCHRVQNANHRKTEVRMKIAVTYEDGKIFQHFGHTEHFKVYEIEENTVVKESMLDANGSGHGALAGLLANNGVDTLICGGIGGGAQMALSEAGIRLYGGVQGNADDAVQSYLLGTLGYDPEARCNHHDHGHGEGHACGEHGCHSK